MMGHGNNSCQSETTYQPTVRSVDLNKAWFGHSDSESDAIRDSFSSVSHAADFDPDTAVAAAAAAITTLTVAELQCDEQFSQLLDFWHKRESSVKALYDNKLSVDLPLELSLLLSISRAP